MNGLRFSGVIRYWRPEKQAGLAVVDVPAESVVPLGGLKQQRVRGTINGARFASSIMPAGGGRLCLSVSKQMMSDAGVGVGDRADIAISSIGRE